MCIFGRICVSGIHGSHVTRGSLQQDPAERKSSTESVYDVVREGGDSTAAVIVGKDETGLAVVGTDG